jgi:transposase
VVDTGGKGPDRRGDVSAGDERVTFVHQHGISGSKILTWRRLMNQRTLNAVAANEEVVPATEYRALQTQVRKLQRLLGKKAMEDELLREAVSRDAGLRKLLLRSSLVPGDVL